VADDVSREEIPEVDPYLEAEDTRQALQHVAWLVEENVEEVA
jgi:lactate dehydrogenase-like 2-hydroxyacid dehydrogenase